jgi:LmbE family N-acetylglucosaminyl deacetylase
VVTQGRPVIDGSGTSEEAWLPWLGRQPWPELDVEALLVGVRRVVVVAAHPDDEVLGIGGLLHRLAREAIRPLVVWATSGEGSHPGSTAIDPARLKMTRRAESAAALAILGLTYDRLLLGRPDAGLVDDVDALAADLADVVHPDDLVLAPWCHDGHPDHDACGEAASRTGARLVEYPIWAWHWAAPGDDRVPWSRARRVPLAEEARLAKARAVETFASQVRPLGPEPEDRAVLPPSVVARFTRAEETVFVGERS